MAEAIGKIVIKLPKDALEGVDLRDATRLVECLFKIAEVGSVGDALHPAESLDMAFDHEGIEIKEGWIFIRPFGDVWQTLMEYLVTRGKGIQVYGNIADDYGGELFFALTETGQSYVKYHSDELDDEGENIEALTAEWLSLLPHEVVKWYAPNKSD